MGNNMSKSLENVYIISFAHKDINHMNFNKTNGRHKKHACN